MSIENMIVTLHRLPTINLNSSTDWLALSGFLVTALVVVLGTWYNAHVFKGTISGQQSIAEANLQYLKSQSKSEFIAKERLQWIETMRDEVSLFLSLGARVQAASQFVIEPSWVTISSNEADLERNRADYGVKYSEFASSLAQGRMHFAKIELLLDLNNDDEKSLIDVMSTYIQAAAKFESINEIGTDVTVAARKVLMKKWEVAKAMSDS